MMICSQYVCNVETSQTFFFCFNHFLDARAEISEIISFVVLGELKKPKFSFEISRPLRNRALTQGHLIFFWSYDDSKMERPTFSSIIKRLYIFDELYLSFK